MNIEHSIDNCTGCQACISICPSKCITMQADEEGFLYPKVAHARCVDCSLCVKRCPQESTNHLASFQKENIVAIKAVSKKLQKSRSASGGAFYTLAYHVLKDGGVVFGAAFDNAFHVRHIYVEKVNDLVQLQGAKYVQSDIGHNYTKVQDFLKNKRKVLFSGTPCQIAGLYAYLGMDYDELITVDLICHGAPSGVLWDKYIDAQRNGKTISDIKFRVKGPKDKSSYKLLIKYCDESKQCFHAEENVYFKGFIYNETFRNSCYQCPFATNRRCGDITIGDCATAVKYNTDDFRPYESVSTVLINSAKGFSLWNFCIDDFEYEELNFQEECKNNHQLSQPTRRPKSRDRVFREGPFRDLLDGKSASLKCKMGVRKKFEYALSDVLSIKMRYHLKCIMKKNKR
ncbi:hypothetical protein HMPREF1032_03774 [Subdoligranulum sp. 4_3_54A2FAA]|nr:hypothetical protein HMPREF1032_03774 [Subdoligranulum sp. 4_3_54A2FAA]